MFKKTVAIRLSQADYSALMALKHRIEKSSGKATPLAQICHLAVINYVAVYSRQEDDQ